MTTEFKRIQLLRGLFADWTAGAGASVVPLVGELATALLGATAPNKARLYVGDGSFSMNSGVPLSIPEIRIIGQSGVVFLPTSQASGLQFCWGTEDAAGAPHFSVLYPGPSTFIGNPTIVPSYRSIADVNAFARITILSNTGFSVSLLDFSGSPLLPGDAELEWFAIGPALNPGYET